MPSYPWGPGDGLCLRAAGWAEGRAQAGISGSHGDTLCSSLAWVMGLGAMDGGLQGPRPLP